MIDPLDPLDPFALAALHSRLMTTILQFERLIREQAAELERLRLEVEVPRADVENNQEGSGR